MLHFRYYITHFLSNSRWLGRCCLDCNFSPVSPHLSLSSSVSSPDSISRVPGSLRERQLLKSTIKHKSWRTKAMDCSICLESYLHRTPHSTPLAWKPRSEAPATSFSSEVASALFCCVPRNSVEDEEDDQSWTTSSSFAINTDSGASATRSSSSRSRLLVTVTASSEPSDVEGSQAVVTKCGHVFHLGCISAWKKTYGHGTCPVCRSPFKLSKVTKLRTSKEVTYYYNKFNGQCESLSVWILNLNVHYNSYRELEISSINVTAGKGPNRHSSIAFWSLAVVPADKSELSSFHFIIINCSVISN